MRSTGTAQGRRPLMRIAIQEALDGKGVEWMEKAGEVQYNS
jgi:hypothetical protein